MKINQLIFKIKLFLNLASLKEICVASQSRGLHNCYHDYKISHGGDGNATHFYIYKCHNCNKEFYI